MKHLLLSLALLSAVTSCATRPIADLTAYKSYHVQTASDDTRGVDRTIAEELNAMSLQGTHGATAGKADALVTYRSQWLDDSDKCLTDLSIRIQDARTGQVLTHGRLQQPGSLHPDTQAEMVHNLLKRIFSNSAAPSGSGRKRGSLMERETLF